MVVSKDGLENSATTISYEETNSSFEDANDQREPESSGDRIRIIQGRRVRRHIKKLDDLDDSDEEFIGENSSNRKQKNVTSSRNNSPNRMNAQFQSKSSEENQSKLIGLKFHDKLLNTGKILTHWSDSQKIVADLKMIEKTADSIISKFTSGVIAATQAKEPSSLESKPLERWSAVESDDQNINDTENRIKPNQVVEEILAKKLQISEENSAENSGKIKEEMQSDRNSRRNSDQNAREILDKVMAKNLEQSQSPPVIFSNLNSWFSNIGSATKIAASATKIAASATMTHAAKQLSNAQNILNQLPIPTMDLNLNSIEEPPKSKHNQESTPQSDVPETKIIEDNNDWNDDGWEDDEPIVLAGREKFENETTTKSTTKGDDIEKDYWNNDDWDDEPVILAKNNESSINNRSKSVETEPKIKSSVLEPDVVPVNINDGWNDWDNDENDEIQIKENVNGKLNKNEASESSSEELNELESEIQSVEIRADPVKSLDNVQNDDQIKSELSCERINEALFPSENDGWDDWDENNYDDNEKPNIEEIRIEERKPTESKNDEEKPIDVQYQIDPDDLEIEELKTEPLVQSNPCVPSISSLNDDNDNNNTNCDIAPSALENLPTQSILEPPILPSAPMVFDSIFKPVGSDVTLPPSLNPALESHTESIQPPPLVVPGELPLIADQNISPINPVDTVAPVIGPPPLDPNQYAPPVFDSNQEPFLCICPPYIPPVPPVDGSLDVSYPSPAGLGPLIDLPNVGSLGSVNGMVDANLVQKEEDESIMDIDVVETNPFGTPSSLLVHQELQTEVPEAVIEDVAPEVQSSLITEAEVKIEDLPPDEKVSGWDNWNDSSIENQVDEIIVEPIVSDTKSTPEVLEAMPTSSVPAESLPDQMATSGEVIEIVELNGDDQELTDKQQSFDDMMPQATIPSSTEIVPAPIVEVEEEEEKAKKEETNAEMNDGEGWDDWQDQSIGCKDPMVLDMQDNSTIGVDDWPEQEIIIDTIETDLIPKIQDSLSIDEPDLEMKEPMVLDVPADSWQDQELMIDPFGMDSVPKIQESLSIDEPIIEPDSNDAPVMEAEPIEIEPVFTENLADVPVALVPDEDFHVSNEDDGDWKLSEDSILDSSIVDSKNDDGVQESILEFEPKSIIEETVKIVKKSQSEAEDDPNPTATAIHKVVKKAEPVWEDDWPQEGLLNVDENNKLPEEGPESSPKTESAIAPKTVEETETAWNEDDGWDDWQDKVEEPQADSIENVSQSEQPTKEKPSVEEGDSQIQATVEQQNVGDESEPKSDEEVHLNSKTVHKIVKKADPIWEDDNGWDDWQDDEKVPKPQAHLTAEEKLSVKKCDPEPEKDNWNDWQSDGTLKLPIKKDCESAKPKFNLVDRFEKEESKSKPKPKFALVEDNVDDWSDDWSEPIPAKPTASQKTPLNRKPEMRNGNDLKQNQIKNPRKPEQPSQTSPPPLSSSAMMMAPSSLSSDQYRQFQRNRNPPTNSSSMGGSWLSDIKAATKTAAVTTVQHAVKNWSFNPISFMDSVVDNLSSAVGVPSAEEMATLMKAKNPSANKPPANR